MVLTNEKVDEVARRVELSLESTVDFVSCFGSDASLPSSFVNLIISKLENI